MNSVVFGVLISFWPLIFQWCDAVVAESSLVAKGFVTYRAVSGLQKSCDCPMPYSCSCCQGVTIFYTKAEKTLCTNFIYQTNGLKIDVTLNSNIIKSTIVTEYKAQKFCVNIPGCLFSSACINVLELNLFPRSITACLRLDIFTKKRLWQLNYNCISISTELPMMSSTMQMANGTGSSGVSMTMKPMMESTMSMTMKPMMESTMSMTMKPMMESTMSMTMKPMMESTMSITMKPTMESTISVTMKPPMESTMPTTKMTMMTMTTMEAAMTTTMKAATMKMIEVEKEETTSDVELISVPGSESTAIMDID